MPLGTIVPEPAAGAAVRAGAAREQPARPALLRTLLVLPLLIPLVAAAALFTFIFLPGDGLLDHYLAQLGVGATNWLGDPVVALGSIIAITVWKNTGYYMLFFLAGLARCPQDLLDAATIDGAGAWQRLRYVILPLLGPTFGFVAADRAAERADAGRPRRHHDAGRAVRRDQPAARTTSTSRREQNYDIGLAAAATVVSVAVAARAVGGLAAHAGARASTMKS